MLVRECGERRRSVEAGPVRCDDPHARHRVADELVEAFADHGRAEDPADRAHHGGLVGIGVVGDPAERGDDGVRQLACGLEQDERGDRVLGGQRGDVLGEGGDDGDPRRVDDGPDGPGGAPGNWLLRATGTGGAAGTDVEGPGGSDAVVAQPVTTGTYELSEAINPESPPPSDEYGATEWTCVGGSSDGDSLTLARGDAATCTITNVFDPPRLTLIKVVNGGPTGVSDWTLRWTDTADPTRTGAGTTGAEAVTAFPVAAGTYRLSESTSSDAESEYAAGAWSCDAGTVVGSALTLTGDEIYVTCTIVNTWTPSTPLPPTGGELVPWFTAAGMGALAAGIAAMLFARRGPRMPRRT